MNAVESVQSADFGFKGAMRLGGFTVLVILSLGIAGYPIVCPLNSPSARRATALPDRLWHSDRDALPGLALSWLLMTANLSLLRELQSQCHA